MASLKQRQALEFKSLRRQETIDSAIKKIGEGFCLKSELTAAEIGFIFENYEQASTIKITSAGLHGGRHYSIYDLIGHSVNGMNYVVTNDSNFNQYISLKLENDFMKKNPGADPHIRASFTSFMHENKLHWSRCCGKSAEQMKAVREKLRTLSSKTGKSVMEILSQLLHEELDQA